MNVEILGDKEKEPTEFEDVAIRLRTASINCHFIADTVKALVKKAKSEKEKECLNAVVDKVEDCSTRLYLEATEMDTLQFELDHNLKDGER